MDLLWRWMKQDLALARRAPFTTRVYLASARAFVAFPGRPPGDRAQAEGALGVARSPGKGTYSCFKGPATL